MLLRFLRELNSQPSSFLCIYFKREDESNDDPFFLHYENEASDELIQSTKDLASWTRGEKLKFGSLGQFLYKKPGVSGPQQLPGSSLVDRIVEKDRFKTLDEETLLKNVKHLLRQHVPDANSLNLDPETDTGSLTALQRKLLTITNTYADLLFTERGHEVAEEVRFVYCLHALNHAVKAKSLIVKHNNKIHARKEKEREAALARKKAGKKAKKKVDVVKDEEVDDVEFRDQGFARPKVLILVPFRNAALRFVDH